MVVAACQLVAATLALAAVSAFWQRPMQIRQQQSLPLTSTAPFLRHRDLQLRRGPAQQIQESINAVASEGSQTGRSEGADAQHQLDWMKVWYPVLIEKDTDRGIPHALTLLDQKLCLWYDAENDRWNCVRDSCPHRLALLSEGRLANNDIQCPQHGWSFDGQGQCTSVPQVASNVKLGRAFCVQSYPAASKQGLVWVWMDPETTPSTDDIATFAPLDEPGVISQDYSRDVPYDYSTLLENVLDASHLPFTHHKTLSNRAKAEPIPASIDEPLSRAGFHGPATANTTAVKTVRFSAPVQMYNKLENAASEVWAMSYAVPLAPGRARSIVRFTFKFKQENLFIKLAKFGISKSPRWLSHLRLNTVIEDDSVFLHHQERSLYNDQGKDNKELLLRSDLFVKQFRKWMQQYGSGGPWGRDFKLPPSHATHAELLDRSSQHAAHCKVCQGADRGLKRAQAVLLTLAAVSAAVAARQNIWLNVLPAVCLLAWKRCAEYRHEIFHPTYPPPRNRD